VKGEKNCCSCRLCGSTVGSVNVNRTNIDGQWTASYYSSDENSKERLRSIGTLSSHFARFLLRNATKLWWRISVFSFCVGYLVIMTVGGLRLLNKVGLDHSDLAPKGSYLENWYDVKNRYLDEVSGNNVYLIVDDENCDYANEENKNALVSIYESMSDVQCILGELGDSWITRIINCMELGCVESCKNTNWTTCYTWFQNVGTYYSRKDGGYGDFVAWRGRFFDTKSMIPKATQMLLKMRADDIRSFDRVECLDGIYSRLKDAPCNMMAFSYLFPFYSGDRTIVLGTVQTMLFAMFTCLAICLVLIPSISVVLIIVACIGFLLIGILGSTYFLGFRLESLTQTMFLMGIGFSVDFAVHVAFSFMQAKGSRLERMGQAVEVMGEAIFLSAITTILGIALLFTSNSKILVCLASMLSLIMVIGLFVAGILLPTVLAMIGPNEKDFRVKDSLNEEMI